MKDEVLNAMGIIKQAVASVQANLEVHTTLQNAIKTVEDALVPKK